MFTLDDLPAELIPVLWKVDPISLAVTLSRGQYRDAKHLDLVADHIGRVASEPLRLCVTLPPRHGKTSLISRWTPVWFLEQWPEKNIILASYGDDLASESGRYVRDTIESNTDRLNVRLRSNSTAAHRFDTTKGGGMRATGIGGVITGRGADLLIIDDYLKNSAEAESKHVRDSVWAWWRGTARTRLEPGASVIILATRWHEDDLIGRLLAGRDADEDEHADAWELVNLPAVAEPGDALGREPGAPLWPARYDTPALAAIKASIGAYNWAAQFQQRPAPEQGRIVLREWWQRYDADDLVTQIGGEWWPAPGVAFDSACLSWDMAFKATSDTDFVVGETWARRGPNVYLLDVVRGRWPFTETVRRFRAQADAWPWVTARLVEEKANGAAVIDTLRNELPGLIAVNPKDGKTTRVHAISPLVEAGNVFVPRQSSRGWADDFVEEWAAFPNGAHDDQVDAGSQALQRLMTQHQPTSVVSPELGRLPRVGAGAGRGLVSAGGGRRLPKR